MAKKQPLTDLLNHFVALAKRGSGQGASGGEKRCHRLAVAILEDCPGIDAEALNGMHLFAALASSHYSKAHELIHGK